MKIKESTHELSRLRLQLQRLLNDLKGSLEVVFGRAPLVKGSVYEQSRKCGKPRCACTGGALHKSLVLSWSHRGKTRLLSIPSERRVELRRKSLAYLCFRAARARVSKIDREILTAIDRVEKLRREEP